MIGVTHSPLECCRRMAHQIGRIMREGIGMADVSVSEASDPTRPHWVSVEADGRRIAATGWDSPSGHSIEVGVAQALINAALNHAIDP